MNANYLDFIFNYSFISVESVQSDKVNGLKRMNLWVSNLKLIQKKILDQMSLQKMRKSSYRKSFITKYAD